MLIKKIVTYYLSDYEESAEFGNKNSQQWFLSGPEKNVLMENVQLNRPYQLFFRLNNSLESPRSRS